MAAHRILVVEDEPMIAMMVEDFLAELEWDIVGVAGTLDQALAMAQEASIDAALLDVNIRGGLTFVVGDVLSQRNIPFVFATGYGTQEMADRFQGVPTLTKPYPRDALERALHEAMTMARDPGSRMSSDETTAPGLT